MTLSIGRRSANYSSAGSMLTVSQISGNAKHLHTLLHQAQAHPSIGAAGGFSVCVTRFWEARYMKRDANNLLSMLRTWQLNDVGATPGFGGSLERALTSIRAKASVMASQTDLYFRPTDMEAEAALIPGARFRVIPSLWGHMAGAGINPPDSEFLSDEIKTLLAA
jgi:hypothetical protein